MPHTQTLLTTLCRRRSRFAFAGLAALFISASAVAQTAHLSSATTQNFGSVNVGTASTPATLTFTFDTAGVLGSTAVVTQGATGLDFANVGSGSCTPGRNYAAGATCTVNVTFTPTRPGIRYGAALLDNSSGAPFATAYLQGTGTGPQVNFSPGTETTIGSGLSYPGGLVVDGNGNVYIGASGGIYKETPSAGGYTQTTLFSDRFGALTIDGVGSLYISGGGFVYKETPSSGGYIESKIGTMYNPNGMAVDGSGNLYVADVFNGRVLKETLSDGSYTQSDILDCGNVGGQSCPSAVAVDANGNVFVTAYDMSQLIELSPSAGGYSQSTVGSGLTWPSQIASDGSGNLYIADTLNSRIVKETFTANGYIQSTVSSSALDWPWAVAVDQDGNVYIDDSYNSRVLKEDLWDAPTLAFATTAIGTTSSDSPKTITVENNGNASLNFPVPSSGENPNISTNFTLNSSGASACPLVSAGASSPGTLAAGASCLLPISFSPTAATPLTGTLALTDNTLNAISPSWATQTIQLSGVTGKFAAQPSITTSVGVLSVGQSITLTVTVIGVSGAPHPSGTVTISGTASSAPFPAQTLTLNSAGVATWTSSSLAIGEYSVTMSYSGDSIYNPATSTADGLFTVYGPPASLKLYTSGTPILAGVAVLYGLPETASGVLLLNEVITCNGAKMDFPYGSTSIKGEDYNALEVFFVPRSAGTLTISCTINGTSVSASLSFTVNPAPLSVTVTPALTALTYGKFTLPVFTSSVSGLVNGDTLGGTVIVSVSSSATAGSGVGVYPANVTLSGSSASNYAATAVGGTIKIEPAPLTIVAKSEALTYGQLPTLPLGYTLYGFVNGDNSSVVSGAPMLSTTVTATTPRGSYPISVEVGTLSAANYRISTIGPQGGTGAVRVYKAPLTVTANSVTMTEGGTVPALTYTITGFVNGEDASVVSGSATLATSVTSSTKAGEYPISVNVSGLSAENYYFVPAVHGGVVKVVK